MKIYIYIFFKQLLKIKKTKYLIYIGIQTLAMRHIIELRCILFPLLILEMFLQLRYKGTNLSIAGLQASPFSSKYNNGHYGQTVIVLFHQTRRHFSKKYNICPHVQLQTVVRLFYGGFGAVASSLLSGLPGYVDIGLV